MNYILFDGKVRNALLPFTFTRPVADIRTGILTIREKWEKHLKASGSTLTEAYLSGKYPLKKEKDNIWINASFLPDAGLVKAVQNLPEAHVLFYKDEVIAYRSAEICKEEDIKNYRAVIYKNPVLRIEQPWDIFAKNGEVLQSDFELITAGRESAPVPPGVNVLHPENIFIEAGARLHYCTINAANGPVYIGKNAEIMEGSLIRGGFALCEGATVKLGAKIYGPTTIGPYSKAGGEINNSVLFGYSNKGHEGFLGNSVIGEWCNLGADTNTSNLKNNYEPVRVWSYETEGFVRTDLQFCGLLMGDHSKCGINTMFNTGTVVGVSANIYGSGFPRNFIPDFSWGGAGGFKTYLPKKAFETAKIVMARRKVEFTGAEAAILEQVFELTRKWRRG